MIAIDTSPLMAILLDEDDRTACATALRTSERIVLSAGTVAEALIAAVRRELGAEMPTLIDELGLEVESVPLAVAAAGRRQLQAMGQGGEPDRTELRRLLCRRSRQDA